MIYSVRGMIGAIVAAGALVGTAGVAFADVKAGVDAWAAGDFASAVREWKGPADSGDPDAQFNLGQAYKLGRGVPRDLTKAEALYAAAAAKGHLEASDSYGLLLFQRGEREKATPYIRAAAARGDARAQYIQGLALFNGDNVEKDWVRAYAYVSLAQQAGLPQATSALAQMDQHIPMADRQKAVALAGQIAAQTEANRARQLAAFDLRGPTPRNSNNAVVKDADFTPAQVTTPASTRNPAPTTAAVEQAIADAARVTAPNAPSDTAQSARTTTTPTIRTVSPADKTIPKTASDAQKPSAVTMPKAGTAPGSQRTADRATASAGSWRVQLGAFGVAGNAEALWARVKNRPELTGRDKLLVPAGNLTKLQAGGFASKSEADKACARLKSAGVSCLATRK